MSATDKSRMASAQLSREKNAATAQEIDTRILYHVSRVILYCSVIFHDNLLRIYIVYFKKCIKIFVYILVKQSAAVFSLPDYF